MLALGNPLMHNRLLPGLSVTTDRPYCRVHVTIIVFGGKGNDEFRKEAEDLAKMYGLLGYDSGICEIPSEDAQLSLIMDMGKTIGELNKSIKQSSCSGLLIIHFCGHGVQTGRAVWAQ
jgi:hypothetical protein